MHESLKYTACLITPAARRRQTAHMAGVRVFGSPSAPAARTSLPNKRAYNISKLITKEDGGRHMAGKVLQSSPTSLPLFRAPLSTWKQSWWPSHWAHPEGPSRNSQQAPAGAGPGCPLHLFTHTNAHRQTRVMQERTRREDEQVQGGGHGDGQAREGQPPRRVHHRPVRLAASIAARTPEVPRGHRTIPRQESGNQQRNLWPLTLS